MLHRVAADGNRLSKRFTRELLDKIDYVIMDPQTVPDSNRYGDTAEVWEHDCYIPDAEEFMEVNMRYYMKGSTIPSRSIFSAGRCSCRPPSPATITASGPASGRRW